MDLARGYIHVAAAKSKTAQRRMVTISPNLRSWLTGPDFANSAMLPTFLPAGSALRTTASSSKQRTRLLASPCGRRMPCATASPATISPCTRTQPRQRSSLATWTPGYCSGIIASWSLQTKPQSFGKFIICISKSNGYFEGCSMNKTQNGTRPEKCAEAWVRRGGKQP